jgi:hypothetical protein
LRAAELITTALEPGFFAALQWSIELTGSSAPEIPTLSRVKARAPAAPVLNAMVRLRLPANAQRIVQGIADDLK